MGRNITTTRDAGSLIADADADGARLGVVHVGGCKNAHCRAAIRAGRAFHAVPLLATPLPDYHFATEDEAVAALADAAEHPHPGLVPIHEDLLASLGDDAWTGYAEAVAYARAILNAR